MLLASSNNFFDVPKERAFSISILPPTALEESPNVGILGSINEPASTTTKGMLESSRAVAL